MLPHRAISVRTGEYKPVGRGSVASGTDRLLEYLVDLEALLVRKRNYTQRPPGLRATEPAGLNQEIRDKIAAAEQHPKFGSIELAPRGVMIEFHRGRGRAIGAGGMGGGEPSGHDAFVAVWERLRVMVVGWGEGQDIYTRHGDMAAVRMLMRDLSRARIGERIVFGR